MKLRFRFTAVVSLTFLAFALSRALALEETSAHSILKHELMDTIVYHEKVARVVDLFGGAIVYRDAKGTEIGTAGRTIMNGHVANYYVNDKEYKKAGLCVFAGLPDQQQPVTVHVTTETLANEAGKPQVFAAEVVKYLSRLPPLKSGETQIVIIDPYFFTYDKSVEALLAEKKIGKTEFLIFSPGDRTADHPFNGCSALVYTETDSSGKILLNADKKPLTYTVAGCGIGTWNKSVADALKQFEGKVKTVGPTAVYIQAAQKPLDFGKYLKGAQDIKDCVTAGAVEEKKKQ
jgi:hypothetical protein